MTFQMYFSNCYYYYIPSRNQNSMLYIEEHMPRHINCAFQDFNQATDYLSETKVGITIISCKCENYVFSLSLQNHMY